MQFIMDAAGMTDSQADLAKGVFAKPNKELPIARRNRELLKGARRNRVSREIAGKTFAKTNGQYMFPESRSRPSPSLTARPPG